MLNSHFKGAAQSQLDKFITKQNRLKVTSDEE